MFVWYGDEYLLLTIASSHDIRMPDHIAYTTRGLISSGRIGMRFSLAMLKDALLLLCQHAAKKSSLVNIQYKFVYKRLFSSAGLTWPKLRIIILQNLKLMPTKFLY